MFFEFGIKDIIDILLTAALLYYIYRLMKDSGSIKIFFGILSLIIIWTAIDRFLQMRLLGSIFGAVKEFGVIAIIVLFQDEIRRFFLTIGSREKTGKLMRFFSTESDDKAEHSDILSIVMACMSMSKDKVGALIIIEKNMKLTDIVSTGTPVDAQITQQLIENIFFKNTPLHDGAMIISNKRIKAAGCILPVSHAMNIPKRYGLRHRAALGMSQESDAIAIVVSEETGNITVAHRGELKKISPEKLEQYLRDSIKKN